MFHVSSLLLMWLLYPGPTALVTNGVIGLFLYFFAKNGAELHSHFYIDESVDTTIFEGASKLSPTRNTSDPLPETALVLTPEEVL